MYKHILFDLDGTVIDTLPALVEAANRTLKKFNFKRTPVTLKEAAPYMGHGTPYLVKCCFKNADLDYNPIVKYYISQQLITHPKLAKEYPNTTKALLLLQALDYSFYIATNKPQPVADLIIPHIFGKDLFKCVVGQNDSRAKKPNPEVINIVINKYKLKRSECLYVGDSHIDILTAKNAKIDCCLITHGYDNYEHMDKKDAKYVIKEIEGLFDILS